MPISADQYEERAQSVADNLRKYIIAFNTGGIAVMLAAAASLSSQCVAPRWVVPAFMFFSLGLVLVLVSLFVQKHKALARRDAVLDKKDPPDFTRGFWRNFTWDIFAASAFATGLLFALSALSSLSPGCT